MSNTVLIADDANFILQMLTSLLEENGFEVVAQAKDGQSCVEFYKQFSPYFVIMDMSMPIKNGLEATIEILQHNPDAKIIGFSSMDEEEIKPQALNAGCIDYITKPFEPQNLLSVIKTHTP